MLRTDEAELIANVGMAAFIALVRGNAIREAMERDSWDSPEVREWTAAALEHASAELKAVSDTLNALYKVAPPCDLGENDWMLHEDVSWERVNLKIVCPDAFSKNKLEVLELAKKVAPDDLTEGLEASGWKKVESDDLPEGVIPFVPRGEP